MHKSRDAGGTRGSIKTEAGRSEITQENQADNLILSRKNYTNNLDECKRKHEVKLRGFPWLRLGSCSALMGLLHTAI